MCLRLCPYVEYPRLRQGGLFSKKGVSKYAECENDHLCGHVDRGNADRTAGGGGTGGSNATVVVWQPDETLINEAYQYRCEYVDGSGGWDTTPYLALESGGAMTEEYEDKLPALIVAVTESMNEAEAAAEAAAGSVFPKVQHQYDPKPIRDQPDPSALSV